jgi:hypothetical protein
VASDRIRISIHILRRPFGGGIGMHPHPGEVVTEALFHVVP